MMRFYLLMCLTKIRLNFFYRSHHAVAAMLWTVDMQQAPVVKCSENMSVQSYVNQQFVHVSVSISIDLLMKTNPSCNSLRYVEWHIFVGTVIYVITNLKVPKKQMQQHCKQLQSLLLPSKSFLLPCQLVTTLKSQLKRNSHSISHSLQIQWKYFKIWFARQSCALLRLIRYFSLFFHCQHDCNMWVWRARSTDKEIFIITRKHLVKCQNKTMNSFNDQCHLSADCVQWIAMNRSQRYKFANLFNFNGLIHFLNQCNCYFDFLVFFFVFLVFFIVSNTIFQLCVYSMWMF